MTALLHTKRLTLRRLDKADGKALVELDSDNAVMRFLTGERPTPADVIFNLTLPQWISEYDQFAGLGVFAAEELSSRKFIGWFLLRPKADRSKGEAELGYRLRQSAWGKGYASEGSRALINLGFHRFDLQKIFAQTMAVNLASRRVMEKSGLSHKRTFHLDWDDPIPGTEEGEVEYAITKAEWLLSGGAS